MSTTIRVYFTDSAGFIADLELTGDEEATYLAADDKLLAAEELLDDRTNVHTNCQDVYLRMVGKVTELDTGKSHVVQPGPLPGLYTL